MYEFVKWTLKVIYKYINCCTPRTEPCCSQSPCFNLSLKKFHLACGKQHLSLFFFRAFAKTINYVARKPSCFLESLFSAYDYVSPTMYHQQFFFPTNMLVRRSDVVNRMYSRLYESTCTFVPEISVVEMNRG